MIKPVLLSCMAVFPVLSPSLRADAAELRKISVCESRLRIRQIAVTHAGAEFLEGRRVQAVAARDADWLHFGPLRAGLYINNVTLHTKDFSGYLAARLDGNRAVLVQGRPYTIWKRSPSGRFAVLMESGNPLFSPVYISDLSSGSLAPIALQGGVNGLFAKMARIDFSADERLVAIDLGIRDHVSIVDPSTGRELRRLGVFGFTRFSGWSGQDPDNLVILSAADNGDFELVRLNAKTDQRLVLIKGAAKNFGSVEAILPKGSGKIAMIANRARGCRVFLLNDQTGGGEVLFMPGSLTNMRAAPNGNYVLARSVRGVLVFSTGTLATRTEIPRPLPVKAAEFNSQSQIAIVDSSWSLELNEITTPVSAKSRTGRYP